MKLFAKIAGIFLLFFLLIAVLGWSLGWFSKGVSIVGPQNVERQYEQVISDYEALVAAAGNACTVQTAGESEKNGKSPTLVEDPTLAYQATYRSIEARYNSTVDNLFKAGIVKPAGYPSSEEIRAIDTSDWCEVEQQLFQIRP